MSPNPISGIFLCHLVILEGCLVGHLGVAKSFFFIYRTTSFAVFFFYVSTSFFELIFNAVRAYVQTSKYQRLFESPSFCQTGLPSQRSLWSWSPQPGEWRNPRLREEKSQSRLFGPSLNPKLPAESFSSNQTTCETKSKSRKNHGRKGRSVLKATWQHLFTRTGPPGGAKKCKNEVANQTPLLSSETWMGCMLQS